MSQRESSTKDQETLDGTFVRFLFRGDDGRFAVGLLEPDGGDDRLRVAGELGDLCEGDHVRLLGRHREDPRFGRQFKVAAAYPILPHTEDGLKGYLSSGRIQSIGPKLAERLVDYFGVNTLDIIMKSPERLTEVDGIGPKRSHEIADQVRDHVFHRDALVFLQGLGISSALAARIWSRHEEKTIQRVRENPYHLAEEVTGIGFKTADRVAQGLGFAPDCSVRAAAALVHILGRAIDEGHVFLPRETLVERVVKLIGDEAPVDAELDALISEGRLLDNDGIYLTSVHELETELAERLVSLASQVFPSPEVDMDALVSRLGLRLADAQRDAVEVAMEQPLMVLTGGPGTGKTTTVQVILKALRRGGAKVVLAAPTGRAARRLAEATGAEATTIHRMLGFHPVEGFRHNEDEPLDAEAVVVDEASMLDQSLAVALLRSLEVGTRLILVGDADQLPSVGAGNVLADILSSGQIPTVELEVVFRQAEQSDIVTNAYRILNGEVPFMPEDLAECDFFVVPAETPERAAELIETLVTERIPRRFGLDPIADVQVLAPMHRGVCGAHQLNERLQACLNPDGAPIKRGVRKFRVGDKVMQIRNDYQKEVFNGDLGRVLGQTESGVAIRFEGRVIDYDREALDNVVLAYACSVHKSQGSEYPAVIVPVLTEHWLMLQRNLLYTAVTRGKRLVVLVGQTKALSRATRNIEGIQRHTQLATRLRALS